MPHVYRKLRTKPIPAGATPKTRRGIAGVQWVDGRGRESWAALHADGKRIVLEDLKWTIQYVDANGKPRETGSGTRDERAAREIAASIEVSVARERRGLSDPAADRYAATLREPVLDHLKGTAKAPGYREWLASEGDTDAHVARTVRDIERILELAGIRTVADLDSARVSRAIRSITTRDGVPISNATYNRCVRSCRAFSTWLYRRKRIRDDVLRDMSYADAAVGRTLFRREITDRELAKIVAQAEKTDRNPVQIKHAKRSHWYLLPDRAWAYRIAAGTGFRANEIGTLTRDAFDLSAKPPTITVEAAYSKRRRRDVQPIADTLAAQLRPWLARKPQGKPLFVGSSRWGQAIKVDAEAAGVAVTTAKGVLDFHALRHTYASRVAAVADAKTGQSLTRHASSQLYLSVYAKQRDDSRIAAVNALPVV